MREVYWMHSLSKNIELHIDEDGAPFVEDPRGSRQKHGDWTWLRSGYFLRWEKPFAENLQDTKVTLIIFCPTPDLTLHMQQLAWRPDWRQAVIDPFSLLVVVAESMFQELSTTSYKLLQVLSYTEHVRLWKVLLLTPG